MQNKRIISDITTMQQEMVQEAQPDVEPLEKILTLKQQGWLTNQPPKRKYLFNTLEAFGVEAGFLPAGRACMIVSPGGCGKTFLLVHCALAAATGTTWLHAKAVSPIRVLFVAAEEDEEELWNRFFYMTKGLSINNNPKLMSLAQNNIIAVAGRGSSYRLIDDNNKVRKVYTNLKSIIQNDEEIKLVILDPAARFMGSETETKNAAATEWVNLIEGLTLSGGLPTVLVAHHTNKSALRPTNGEKCATFDQSMARGASALVDGFRWTLGLQRSEQKDNTKSIFIKMLKSNYSKTGPTLEFEQDYENSGILKYKGPANEKDLTFESSNNEGSKGNGLKAFRKGSGY